MGRKVQSYAHKASVSLGRPSPGGAKSKTPLFMRADWKVDPTTCTTSATQVTDHPRQSPQHHSPLIDLFHVGCACRRMCVRTMFSLNKYPFPHILAENVSLVYETKTDGHSLVCIREAHIKQIHVFL